MGSLQVCLAPVDFQRRRLRRLLRPWNLTLPDWGLVSWIEAESKFSVRMDWMDVSQLQLWAHWEQMGYGMTVWHLGFLVIYIYINICMYRHHGDVSGFKSENGGAPPSYDHFWNRESIVKPLDSGYTGIPNFRHTQMKVELRRAKILRNTLAGGPLNYAEISPWCQSLQRIWELFRMD